MISVAGLALQSGAFRLADVSFAIPAGAYGVLMGQTGSGKSSILEAICGLRRIQAGSILVDGRDVSLQRPGSRGIGYVPQDGALFSTMTVAQHLGFALHLRRRGREAIVQRVREVADQLEIAHLLGRLPQGLSGGERQRVALGRAISWSPSVLLLDEPMSALDEGAQGRMRDLLAKVHRGGGLTVLHVTHSSHEAEALGTFRLYLNEGKVVERCT